MKQLCVVTKIETLNVDGRVITLIELLGGDRWGCSPNKNVHCAWCEAGCLVPAREITEGMKIWLDIPALVADGTFVANIN